MIEVIVKMLFIVLVMMGALLPLITWVERKQAAIMQDRIGANRADLFGIRALGLLHPAADVLKLLTKEDVVPRGANRVLHLLAPVIALVPAIITLAVIPFGGVYQFGETRLSLVVADIDWGMLYVLAVGSIATYGAVIAGWASNNNWSLLGSMRASSQMISYEVTMGLSLVGLFMAFGTLRLPEMAIAQDTTFRLLGFLEVFGVVSALPAWLDWIRLPAWGIFLQPLGFILFLTCIMAENKRPPFDAPEGESEIIAGYHMEYSGMRFGLFYTAEFLEVPVIGALVATLFLGGWSIPYLSQETIISGISSAMGVGFATGLCLILHVTVFLLKVVFLIWLQMLIRWTLPRFRYDQVMDLCWKYILPLSIANAFVTGAVILLAEGALVTDLLFYLFGGLAVAGALGMVLNVRNTVAGAMSLVLTMVSLGGIYVLLEAYLVGVLQILIYAGAIVVLFLFVVMLLNLRGEQWSPDRIRVAKVFGVAAAGVLLLLLFWLVPELGAAPELRPGFGGYRDVGLALFTDWVVAFESTSLLLLTAMIGAVVLAKRKID